MIGIWSASLLFYSSKTHLYLPTFSSLPTPNLKIKANLNKKEKLLYWI